MFTSNNSSPGAPLVLPNPHVRPALPRLVKSEEVYLKCKKLFIKVNGGLKERGRDKERGKDKESELERVKREIKSGVLCNIYLFKRATVLLSIYLVHIAHPNHTLSEL